MSIKDLFSQKGKSTKVIVAENAATASQYVESVQTVKAKYDLNNQFVPHIDFATASNFAKFGSAELYYEYGFKRIYNEYPYDGTEREKIEFRLSSSYLDDYIFENLYPRVNGYIQFSAQGIPSSEVDGYGTPATAEYILTKGGPHTASGGMIGETLKSKFGESNYYDSANDLGSSLEVNFDQGVSVEFWLKKSSWDTTNNHKEVIFDLWNYEDSSSVDYGRLTIGLTASADGANPFCLTVQSGTAGFFEYTPTISGITTASVGDGSWHHYALTFTSQSAGIETKVYVDGVKKVSDVYGSSGIGNFATISGNLSTIGGVITAPSGTAVTVTGSGKLNAYMDEFRYWKKSRTDKQIANSFFIPLGGGNNENDYNRKLGVYYKFNEGITGTDSTDSVVLDYSGRLANGVWTGYTSSARSTNSAMVESGYARSEFKDPIIYSYHPDVVSTLATLTTTGSLQDNEGTSKLISLMPGWLQEEDSDIYNNQIKKFLQILASYFDNLNAQIGELSSLRDENYPQSDEEPYFFAKRLVESRGLVVPDFFTDGDLINYLLQKDDNEIFEQNISDVKNRIYHNIYNNLTYILKSKGTEKSFRNLLRCFGIDSEVVRLSLYADDGTYVIQENYEDTSIEKKFLNLNNRDNFEGTIYNVSSSDTNFTYISSSEGSQEEHTAMTVECETFFPFKLTRRDDGYFETTFLTSSIYGFHRALTSSASDYTWHSDDTDIQVYAVRNEREGKDGYFVLTSSLGFEITSSTYFNLYDNNKWNFAVRVRNEKYPYTSGLSGSTGADYLVEFVGYNSIGNYVQNNFSLSSSISNAIGKQLLCNSKRLYAGAHRTNFTGSTLLKSDVLVSDVKFWQSYLDDETIKLHSYNPDNVGTKTPFRPDNVNTGIENLELTDLETLALHWRMDTQTTSDSSGEFTGFDFASGSTENASRNSWLGGVTGHKYPFRGEGFVTSSAKAFDKRFIYSAKQRKFGVLMSSDGVTIKNDANTLLFTDDDVSDNFYAFEKSYSGVISEEMLKLFASLVEFNDLVGQPIDGYKRSYKELEKLSRLFFEKVENRIEPEKFFDFYRWIDNSIMFALKQLFPASAKYSDTSRNIIESHLLERNKYDRKFPLLVDVTATEGYAKGISELLYNWKFGHAPVPQNFATSLKFGKTSSAARLIDSSTPSYPTTGGFSLAAWIKVEDFGGNAVIYTAQNSSSQTSILFFVNENALSFQATDPSGNANVYQYSITGIVDWNNWNYVAVSWDGNFANDAEFYLNGVTSIAPTTITKLGSGTTLRDIDKIIIGDPSISEIFYVSSLAIWNSSLSSNSVGDHYYFGEFNPIENNRQYSDLISYYKFGINDAAGAVTSVTDIISGFDVTKDGSGDLDYVLDSPYSFYGISENENCNWQKHRKDRKYTYGKFDATTDRQTILDSLNNGNNVKHLAKITKDGTIYAGSTYALRNFTNLSKFSVEMDKNYHGGTNYSENKNRDAVWDATYVQGPVSTDYPKGIPQNVLAVGLGEGQGTEAFIDCVDVENPNEKRKWRFTTVSGRKTSTPSAGETVARTAAEDYQAIVKGEITWPANLVSASVTTGYQSEVVSKFKQGVVITNLHSDTYAPGNEIGMQGPFTEAWVGGHQSRHVNLNRDKGSGGLVSQTNATAVITIADLPNPGDTITFGDGVTGPTVFTYSLFSNMGDNILRGATAAATRTSTKSKLEARFNVNVNINGDDLEITNNNAGPVGNVTLSETFTSANNTVSGFTGGENIYGTTNNLDDQYSREEGWRLLLKECSDAAWYSGSIEGANDGAMGFVGPDYGGPYPDTSRKYAVHYREERAKRPVNVKNIQTTTSSVRAGNFTENYEVFNTTGRLENRRGATLTTASVLSPFYDGLPQTTQEASLIGTTVPTKATAILEFPTNPSASDTITIADGVNEPITYEFVSLVATGNQIHIQGSAPETALELQAAIESDFNISMPIGFSSTITLTNNNLIGQRANVSLSASFTPIENSITDFSGAFGGGNLAINFNGNNRIPQEIRDQQVYDPNVRSNSIIATRFSAPGGFETMSEVYLDVPSKEYSAYNAMPFRNLMVRGSGSGEDGTIRLNDIHGNRFGLQTHLRRHAGQFGYDSAVGSETTETNYVTTGSFHKINRNRLIHLGNETKADYTAVTSSQYDNGFVTHQIPRSDYQNSWITSSLAGDRINERFYGFAPENGFVSSSTDGIRNAYNWKLKRD